MDTPRDRHVPRADRNLIYLVTRHSKHGVQNGASLLQTGAESAARLALKSGGETSANGFLLEFARKKERSYFLDVKAAFSITSPDLQGRVEVAKKWKMV